MRSRLRPAYTPEQLAALYAEPHKHTRWPDHVLRVEAAIALGRALAERTGLPRSIADLSCGDAAIADALHESAPGAVMYLGDIAPGWTYHGPVEETIWQIGPVDLFICCETIEHLDDPDDVLRKIRTKARSLLLSTPDSEDSDANPEHYWRWDTAAVRDMLTGTGWDPVLSVGVTWHDPAGHPWAYQIWGCV